MNNTQRSKAFNRIADAYNSGIAPWLYDDAGSVAVRAWCLSEKSGGLEAADSALAGIVSSLAPLFEADRRARNAG